MLTDRKKVKKCYSLCTISSINNAEINRAIELTKKYKIDHEIIPFNYQLNVDLNTWNSFLRAVKKPTIEIDAFSKFIIAQCIAQKEGNEYDIITGIGSDHFNGGHTTIDYAKNGLNPNWDSFLRHFKEKFYGIESEQIEFYGLLQNEVNNEASAMVMDYFKAKHIGMMKGSLRDEFSMERYFNFQYICPFLDPRLVDFVTTVPSKFYQQLFFKKQILRSVGDKYLPKSFRNTTKVKTLELLRYAVQNFFKRLYFSNKEEMDQVILQSNFLKAVFQTEKLEFVLSKINNELEANINLVSYMLNLYNYAYLHKSLANSDPYGNTAFIQTYGPDDLDEIKNTTNFHLFELDSMLPLYKVMHLSEKKLQRILNATNDSALNGQLIRKAFNAIDEKLTLSDLLKRMESPHPTIEQVFHQLFKEGMISNYPINSY